MTRTRAPDFASAADRFTTVVVFPTPPFWLEIVKMRVRDGRGSVSEAIASRLRVKSCISCANGVDASKLAGLVPTWASWSGCFT